MAFCYVEIFVIKPYDLLQSNKKNLQNQIS